MVDDEDVVDDEEDDTLVVVAIEVVSSAVVVVDAKNPHQHPPNKSHLAQRTHVFALLCALPSTRKQSISISILFLFFVVDQNDTGAMQKREGLG